MDQEERVKGGRKSTRVLTILIVSIALITIIYSFMNLFMSDVDTMVPDVPNTEEGSSELDEGAAASDS